MFLPFFLVWRFAVTFLPFFLGSYRPCFRREAR